MPLNFVELVVGSFSLAFDVWPLNKEQEIRTPAYDVFHHGGTIIHDRESFELSQGLLGSGAIAIEPVEGTPSRRMWSGVL